VNKILKYKTAFSMSMQRDLPNCNKITNQNTWKNFGQFEKTWGQIS
jgi:hypothetical protein